MLLLLFVVVVVVVVVCHPQPSLLFAVCHSSSSSVLPCALALSSLLLLIVAAPVLALFVALFVVLAVLAARSCCPSLAIGRCYLNCCSHWSSLLALALGLAFFGFWLRSLHRQSVGRTYCCTPTYPWIVDAHWGKGWAGWYWWLAGETARAGGATDSSLVSRTSSALNRNRITLVETVKKEWIKKTYPQSLRFGRWCRLRQQPHHSHARG